VSSGTPGATFQRVSYDVAVWVGAAPRSDQEARNGFQRRLPFLDDYTPQVHPALEQFLDDVLERYPDEFADDAEAEDGIWSVTPMRDTVALQGEAIYLTLTYPGARRALGFLVHRANAHGLVLFDCNRGRLLTLRAGEVMPRLRARPSDGPVVDEPSVDRLVALMTGLTGERGSFLVLERLDRFSEEHYMQLYRDSLGDHAPANEPVDDMGSVVLEVREGSADRHLVSPPVGFRDAHRILCDWAFDRADWRSATNWTKLEL
jgi:hypothetical protein